MLCAAVAATAACSHGGSSLLPKADTIGTLSVASATAASDPANWLAQKVCVDSSNHPVAVDPYSSSDPYGNGCAGYTERNIQQGDSVPYYRYVNPGTGGASTYWYAYSYPVTSPSGEQMYVMARQFTPQNASSSWYVNQNFYPGHTHWDMYRIQGGYVSNATTRDNSGLSQTFYGNTNGTATPYNGWVDFPTAYLSSFGTASPVILPTRGVYWEESGMSWPLPTQSTPTGGSTQTTWNLLQGYTFDSGKKMNTLVAYHQSQPQPSSTNPDNGHMEIWYFTMPYGPSRWEVWSAASCLGTTCKPTTPQQCAATGSKTFMYQGKPYTYWRTNCVDWTRTMTATSSSTLPALPIPEADMLANMHFSDDAVNTSGKAGGWTVGSNLTLSQLQSTLSGDTRSGKYPGVRYARIACTSTCSSGSALSQDVPVTSGGTFLYGAVIRGESTGQVRVTLAQVDANGNVLANTAVSSTATVTSVGDNSSCNGVVNCSTFVGARQNVTLVSGAAKLRMTIAPLTSGVKYDLSEADLGRQ